MTEESSSDEHPRRILGRRVIEVCPTCRGEGLLWDCDEAVTTHWAERCVDCNCVGYILDFVVPEDSDQEDAPF